MITNFYISLLMLLHMEYHILVVLLSICTTLLQGHTKRIWKTFFPVCNGLLVKLRGTQYPVAFQPLPLCSSLRYEQKCFVWPCTKLLWAPSSSYHRCRSLYLYSKEQPPTVTLLCTTAKLVFCQTSRMLSVVTGCCKNLVPLENVIQASLWHTNLFMNMYS